METVKIKTYMSITVMDTENHGTGMMVKGHGVAAAVEVTAAAVAAGAIVEVMMAAAAVAAAVVAENEMVQANALHK
jgi:hypothetical protein